MSHNSFGHLFRMTTFGESHGPLIGAVVDGCPPRLPLQETDIQPFLDKRRPGQSRFTTQRQEEDRVKIVSGLMIDPETGLSVTTGTPLALLIENQDQRSKDYTALQSLYRPGHADFTYEAKYGLRDARGGGRSSARETALRVAVGAIARKIIPFVHVQGALIQLGPLKIDRHRWNWDFAACNPFSCPDPEALPAWEEYLDRLRKEGSSCGALIELLITGVPPGWGAPLYGKLDAELASALMSINAVKAVEIGDGLAAAASEGKDHGDEMRALPVGMQQTYPIFLSNHAGGILGGISTGQPLILRFAVKPTSSILTPRQSVNRYGEEVEVQTKGRHDPCVGLRAVPVGEAMALIVLADAFLRHRAQVGSSPPHWPFPAPLTPDEHT